MAKADKKQFRRVTFKKMPHQKPKTEIVLEAKPIPKLEFTYDQVDEIVDKESFNRGKKLYQYQEKKSKQLSPQDQQWLHKLLNTGTAVDRISALSIQIKDDPQHALTALHKVLEVASVKQRDKSLKAFFTLKDLFVHILLKRGMPMQFDKGEGDEVQRYYWHCMLKMVECYVNLIVEAATDPIAHIRRQIILIMVELHAAFPIPTQQLIPALVNKFGENDKSLISLLTKKLSYNLSLKPALTYPILREAYGFMHRPNLPLEAQYYCLNFMNSLNLQTQEPGTLSYLLKVFFIFFKKLVGLPNADTAYSRLFTQVLRGLNKTIPFGQKFMKNLQELYKEHEKLIFKLIASSTNFKIKIQTLYFVYQVQETLNDHYYRSLYEMVLHQELESTSLAELFFDLYFQSVKQDTHIGRQRAFVKRLLQVAMNSNLSFIVTSLVCVHKLSLEIPMLLDAKSNGKYDPLKRNPEFAEACDISELHTFIHHYHPKVQSIAKSIIAKSQEIQQKANPLVEYSQSTFLARFCEANNKKINRISNLSRSKISDEDAFKTKYLEQRIQYITNRASKKKTKVQVDSDEEDGVADELFEKELNKHNKVDEEDIDDEDDDMGFMMEEEDDEQYEQGEEGEQYEEGEEQYEDEDEQYDEADEADEADEVDEEDEAEEYNNDEDEEYFEPEPVVKKITKNKANRRH